MLKLLANKFSNENIFNMKEIMGPLLPGYRI